ncbi:MAG TPA: hypothetical protein VLT82_17475 [Myxococcaceae bacterium]|nr:hypothetical protein [Myxococcaceae bacterium]
MPTAPSSDAERPPPRPGRRVLARAVGVWWVQQLLEVARRRRPSRQAREDEDPRPAPATR